MNNKNFKRTFEPESLRTPTVLLIERSDDYTQLFKRHFLKVALHWKLVNVSDGSAAIHHMTFIGFPDLLVTGLDVPKLSAMDIVEWVRTMKTPKPIPILIYDSTPPAGMRNQLAKFNVCDFLDKTTPEPKFKSVLMRYVARAEQEGYIMDTPPTQH